MADAEVPALEVGFAIDFFDSFWQLKSMDDLIGVTAANAVREYQKVEAATKGMSLSGATASVGTFGRSDEHTSELQSLMRISYAVFCLKKKTQPHVTQYPAPPHPTPQRTNPTLSTTPLLYPHTSSHSYVSNSTTR